MLGKAMAEVERRLLEVAADAGEPLLAEAATYLLAAGGKRWRPRLVLLGAQFGDPEQAAALDAAVAVELVHAASLHHDDVMDEAPLRHAVATAHLRWSNKVAILVGDHLFAKAGSISMHLDERARVAQARAMERLVAGQVREVAGPLPGQDPIAHYLSVVSDKSASLIALAAELGGLCSGAPLAHVAALRDYGEAFGIAFQLADDLLDIRDGTGKAAGTDLRAGVRTLPTLLALAENDERAARLRVIVEGGPVADPAEALELVRGSAGTRKARAMAGMYGERARAILARLPYGQARQALADLCDLVTVREE